MKDLTNSKEFIGRHIGPSDEHIKTMLSYLNVKSLEELIQKIAVSYTHLTLPTKA